MIFLIRPAFCAQVAFLTAVPNRQPPCLDSGSDSDNDLLSCRSCHHLSLSCLSCLLCHSCPPPSDLRCFLSQLFTGCELTSAGFNVGLDLTSNLAYMISRARFVTRCCFNSLGTKASSEAVLMSSSRAAAVVPHDLLLSYRRTSSSHFSSPARIDLEPRFVAEEVYAFLLSESPNHGPTVSTLRDLNGAATRTISKLSLSLNARSAT